MQPANGQQPLVEIKDLRTWFPIHTGLFRRVTGHVKAVDGVDLTIHSGETVGLVGESGCGKTTLGMTVLRLVDASSGEVLYYLEPNTVDVLSADSETLFRLRRHMQVIFQDPYASLDPRMAVGDVVGEYLDIHKIPNKADTIVELLEAVGLNAAYLYRYPHEFSGGQRQRIAIARALSLNPDFIVCDEAVSALDVSIQAQIINLLTRLQRERGLAYLFIAHDLNVVRHMSDRVAVMYLGKIVEYGSVKSIFLEPKHPYTEALLSAIPRYRSSGPGLEGRVILEGDVPSAANPPSGCRFHTRCPYAEAICKVEEPELATVQQDEQHQAACHFTNELTLRGSST